MHTTKKRDTEVPRFLNGIQIKLLDLGFLELDMLASDRVVLRLRHLVRERTAVLRRHVEETCIGRRQQLDLDGRSFRHGLPASNKKSSRGRLHLVHGKFWRETTNRARKVKSVDG